MRFRGSFCALVICVLLVLSLHAGSATAAGPPSSAIDPRRTWQGENRSFRYVGFGKWVGTSSQGKAAYRENDRKKDFIELLDPETKQYYRLYPQGMYLFVPNKEHFRWVGAGLWDDPQRRPLDLTRNATDRKQMSAADQRRSFPRLGDNYELMAPSAVTYNCIAWSLGTNSSWVWPKAAGQPVTIHDFDALYGIYGYRRIVGLDVSRQPHLDKVVLYARRGDEGNTELTHASRQLSDGTWSSKLGSLPLIRHLKPEDVGGPTYGDPYVVYVRAKTNRTR